MHSGRASMGIYIYRSMEPLLFLPTMPPPSAEQGLWFHLTKYSHRNRGCWINDQLADPWQPGPKPVTPMATWSLAPCLVWLYPLTVSFVSQPPGGALSPPGNPVLEWAVSMGSGNPHSALWFSLRTGCKVMFWDQSSQLPTQWSENSRLPGVLRHQL